MSQPPYPPREPDLQVAIDKFACYVAKNGPGVEEITRRNQYGNPRFSFLFGGEHTEYYRYRLISEINKLQQQHQPPPSSTQQQHQFFQAPPPPPLPPQSQQGRPLPLMSKQVVVPSIGTVNHRLPHPPSSQMAPVSIVDPIVTLLPKQLQEQIAALRKQISDSTANLKAQSDALQLQREKRVNKLWADTEDRRLKGLITQVQLNINEFEPMINHMSQSGSKDTISNAKHWIFDHCGTDKQREIILTYLLHRVRVKIAAGEPFRLHILYLINEWAHYCQRKSLDSIRQMLSRYVPKLYAHAYQDSSLKEKLDRLVHLWENSKAFDDNCYKQLANPSATLIADQSIISAEQAKLAVDIDMEIAETYVGYQKQHSEFERHILGKIAALEVKVAASSKEAVPVKEPTIPVKEGRRSRFDKSPATSQWNKSQDELLIPKCPYYELPAGIMVPLVGLEDCTFKPIPVKGLRLPPPKPPSDHLLNQIAIFYSAPTPDNPRDADGWEVNGLSDYYKKKAEHRLKLEEQLKKEGKYLEEVITNRYTAPPDDQRRSRSRSKKRRRRNSSGSGSSSNSSQSRSPSPLPPPPPPRHHHHRRKRSRSRSASPDERRAGFGGGGGDFNTPTPTPSSSSSSHFKVPPLPSANKGAQLMAKMGWEGKGLGSKSQGIEEPIDGGEVRTRDTQYLGVGSKSGGGDDDNDIYTEYRRQMSNSISSKVGRKDGGKWE